MEYNMDINSSFIISCFIVFSRLLLHTKEQMRLQQGIKQTKMLKEILSCENEELHNTQSFLILIRNVSDLYHFMTKNLLAFTHVLAGSQNARKPSAEFFLLFILPALLQ